MSDSPANPSPAPETPKKPQRSGAEVEKAFHEEAALASVVDSRLLAALWPYVKPYGPSLLLALVLMPVSAELLVAQPRILRSIVDDGIARGDMSVVNHACVRLAMVLGADFIARFVQTYMLQVVGQRSMADLRRNVFAFLERQRMSFFDRQPIGRLVTRATNDIDTLGELFASGSITAIGDAFTLVRIVIAMVAFSPSLSLYTFIAVPPLVVMVNMFRKRAREAFREIRAKTARLNAYLNEQVIGVAVVQAYGQEQRCQQEFHAINQAYKDANFLSIRYDALLFAVVEAFSSVCIATLLFVGARQLGASEPAASIGVLVAFVQYIQRFFEPLRDISSKFTIMQSAMAAAERIFSLLDKPEPDAPAREHPAGARPAARNNAKMIEFRDVKFGYSADRPTLRGVTFAVEKGRSVALVGATGAGKTTVIALLQRLYEIDEGEILLDGEDIRDMDAASVRKRFVVVPQDTVLFPGDVLSNVALGDKSPDRARAERMVRDIGLDRLLAARGAGLDAQVSDRGQNFSAGERQLIALARALYRDPEVLVLDEATSSMDSESEAVVQEAIARALHGRTSMVIAHRLSTIRTADEILVFHRGVVAERGTHEDLLSQNGIYARLHRLQFSEVAA